MNLVNGEHAVEGGLHQCVSGVETAQGNYAAAGGLGIGQTARHIRNKERELANVKSSCTDH